MFFALFGTLRAASPPAAEWESPEARFLWQCHRERGRGEKLGLNLARCPGKELVTSQWKVDESGVEEGFFGLLHTDN